MLRGLHVYYRNRAEYRTARELAEQYLGLAERRDDPVERLQAYHMLALTLHFQGELTVARSYFEHSLALYTAEPHPVQGISGEDYGVIARTRLSWVLWYLGYPDQALRQNREALALAQELAHPLSLATALVDTALLHQLRREACAAQEHAEAAIALTTEQGFRPLETLGTVVYGWALAMQGHGTQGLVQMQQGLAAARAMGSERGHSHIVLPTWPQHTAWWANQRQGCRYWPRRWLRCARLGRKSTSLSGTGSRGSSCWRRKAKGKHWRRQKPASSRPSTLPGASRPGR